ncbi:MAG TPA: hypothetical protein VGR28_00405 [Candidatus Thermoplasmatota archaeon]|nr:hypothetical protein [Candidatus Thermoplasmatota archaeon]
MLALWSARLGPALLAALVLAGCVSPASPATVAPASALDEAPAAFAMTATDCEEGGFVAAYNADQAPQKLADVWELADIREEIGNPIHDAVGRPTAGALVGNWHMGFRCASVTSTGGDATDYLFGYVGDMIEAPAWDTGGADLHFLVSGLGFADGPIADALRASTIADITPATEARVDWLVPKEAPRSAAYVVYTDGEKGTYESWSDLALLRDAPERTIRLWWQVPANGTADPHAHHNAMRGFMGAPDQDAEGAWHPIYWDLHVAGGPQYTTPPLDGVELASHNRLSFEHGPVVAQPTLTNIYELRGLTFTSGHVVEDVVLTKLWNH